MTFIACNLLLGNLAFIAVGDQISPVPLYLRSICAAPNPVIALTFSHVASAWWLLNWGLLN